MLRLKSDVRVIGLRAEMLLAAMVANSVYARLDRECVITSGMEGKHSAGSLHYVGAALDFGIQNVPTEQISQILRELSQGLGPDYDVVLERDHLHVEFQPKMPLVAAV